MSFLMRGITNACLIALAICIAGCSALPLTRDQFDLRVEPLVDNVADFDVRRFIVRVSGENRKVAFHIGTAGITQKGVHTPDDPPGIRRLEAILTLRLTRHPVPSKGRGYPHVLGEVAILRYLKFGRDYGASIEGYLDAPGVESLAGVVNITVGNGRYPVGRPVVLGTVHGSDLVVLVE